MLSVTHTRHTKSISSLLRRKVATFAEWWFSKEPLVKLRKHAWATCRYGFQLTLWKLQSSPSNRYRSRCCRLRTHRRYLSVLPGDAPPHRCCQPIGMYIFTYPAHNRDTRLFLPAGTRKHKNKHKKR